ncbi:CBS domain-containing protein [Haliovirga abyssi]|uniref:CBS domain-containing protein n=1 Tax=Haliovirga abyssi TaxID=2996794 RepID=A0AAU9DHH5_9FUSO|nr:CBS domain-containing protein [Haliovirga abyssi]BDU50189.1 hypothetical protein HLVA_07580 [Haliovirga abyssi]
MKKIKDIVNRDIITVKKDSSLENIIKIMKENKIGKIPVLENEEVIGIVTRDDILVKEEKAPLPPVLAFWDVLIALPRTKEFEEKLKKLAGYTAEEIMSVDFMKIDISEKIEDVLTKIIEEKYGYAVVYEKGKFCGIITKSDFIEKSY